MNDLESLRQYVVHGSHDAFAELVTRYLPLVYTAARRQVRSPDLANDVAQTVFLDLARHAPKLRPDTSLPAWLYVATRRTAIDLVRREASRTRRDQTTMEVVAMNVPQSPWAEIEPLLDQAMNSLSAPDQQALLARFFENQSIAEVSRTLRCSDDAAQKRVSRALDRLRAFFTKRGLVTASAALAADLSSFAVQPAPSGLNLSIAATAAQQWATAFSGAAARGVAFNGFAKAAFIAVCAAAAGLVVYQPIVLHRQTSEIAALSALATRWETQSRSLQAAHDRARPANATAARATEPFSSSDAEFDTRLKTVLAHVAAVRQRFAADPAQRIAELAYLSDSDWFAVVEEQEAWGTTNDWRAVLGHVRTRAKNRLTSKLQVALQKYVEANAGELPTDVAQLGPFFDAAPDPSIFARLELKETGRADRLSRHATVIQEKKSTAIDPPYDNLAVMGMDFTGVTSVNLFGPSNDDNELDTAMEVALKAYRAANPGKEPASPQELTPYFQNPGIAASFERRALLSMNPLNFSEPNAMGHAMNLYRFANHGESPTSPEKLAPYFQDPYDAARFLLAQVKMSAP